MECPPDSVTGHVAVHISVRVSRIKPHMFVRLCWLAVHTSTLDPRSQCSTLFAEAGYWHGTQDVAELFRIERSVYPCTGQLACHISAPSFPDQTVHRCASLYVCRSHLGVHLRLMLRAQCSVLPRHMLRRSVIMRRT